VKSQSRARFLPLLVFLSACHSWSEINTSLAPNERLPSPARVELVTGEKVEVRSARVEGDSLIAYHADVEEVLPDGTVRALRIAVPVEDVAGVERWKPNTTLTGAGVLLGASAIFFGLLVVALSSGF
jgi:hypothetical protein